ncbi:uncharacterized protein PFL1_02990 [Pseudozyma flocculosa PF-1]|uniref:Related to carbonyl reductase n=2 Tax=Pseudozyma flocculosa TaxID=84751 RepID=A0A5C3F148_9BASI|nr:uncharacterized protein PFL1_02990 [Pseudozyma flocculosa PF-1]EPQ29235.1 hypothetical protein PFL1_02990 [Pseudozyma flocculosa PF-1]SPO37735.1 related to carbonyl reductase [Pseudozyma flocculosa]
MSNAQQQAQTILVTGANKGIGYEAVRHLSEVLPHSTILLGTRSVRNGDEAIAKMRSSSTAAAHDYANIKVLQLDITDAASLAAAVKTVETDLGGRLDVLLHNSGIAQVDGVANHAGVLEVNVYGAIETVHAFLPLLRRSSNPKLVLVSSEVGAWYMHTLSSSSPALHAALDDATANDEESVRKMAQDWIDFAIQGNKEPRWTWPDAESRMTGAYCTSKALVSAWTRNFALRNPDVKVAIVCPGYCATELNNFSGPRSAAQGGESVAWPVLHDDFESGRFYRDGKLRPFTSAMPDDFATSTD